MAGDKTGYGVFRDLVKRIDAAFDAIEAAKRIPDNLAYDQGRVTAYCDSYGGRDVSDTSKNRAKAALARAVDEARAEGERERDRIIAEQKIVIESLRGALSSACGAAVIDLGCRARAPAE